MKTKQILLLWLVPLLCACMDGSAKHDDCVSIEAARCELRSRCDDGFDVAGCKAYYEEQCRARTIEVETTGAELDACINDIDALGSVEECKRIDQLGSKQSEICLFDELAACRLFLCIDPNDTASSAEAANTVGDTGTADTETTAPASGLNP